MEKDKLQSALTAAASIAGTILENVLTAVFTVVLMADAAIRWADDIIERCAKSALRQLQAKVAGKG